MSISWVALGCAAGPAGSQGTEVQTGTVAPDSESIAAPVPRLPKPTTVEGRDTEVSSEPFLAAESDSVGAQCREGMALVVGGGAEFCVDRFEASIVRAMKDGDQERWPSNVPVDGVEDQIIAVSLRGVKPQGFINGLQASVACQRAGKRLCSSEEWATACRGKAGTRYPYGDERRAGVCNDRFRGLEHHPVVRLFRRTAPAGADDALMWTHSWINDPRLHELSHTVSLTGSFPECVSDFGVADMVGNLHEWVADDGGVFRGGFFMDTYQHGEGCEYKTSAHASNHHDYSTGFRCCADPS